jgi:hypothetical protein
MRYFLVNAADQWGIPMRPYIVVAQNAFAAMQLFQSKMPEAQATGVKCIGTIDFIEGLK